MKLQALCALGPNMNQAESELVLDIPGISKLLLDTLEKTLAAEDHKYIQEIEGFYYDPPTILSCIDVISGASDKNVETFVNGGLVRLLSKDLTGREIAVPEHFYALNCCWHILLVGNGKFKEHLTTDLALLAGI